MWFKVGSFQAQQNIVFLDSIGAVFLAKMCVAGGLADPGEDFAIG
jgi:hypothetical protein